MLRLVIFCVLCKEKMAKYIIVIILIIKVHRIVCFISVCPWFLYVLWLALGYFLFFFFVRFTSDDSFLFQLKKVGIVGSFLSFNHG